MDCLCSPTWLHLPTLFIFVAVKYPMGRIFHSLCILLLLGIRFGAAAYGAVLSGLVLLADLAVEYIPRRRSGLQGVRMSASVVFCSACQAVFQPVMQESQGQYFEHPFQHSHLMTSRYQQQGFLGCLPGLRNRARPLRATAHICSCAWCFHTHQSPEA